MKMKYLIDEGKELGACQNIRGDRFSHFLSNCCLSYVQGIYLKTYYLIDGGKEFRASQNIGGERRQKESGKMSSLDGNYSYIVWYKITFCLVQFFWAFVHFVISL